MYYSSSEFDYQLWSTKEPDGNHYYARIKSTGQVTEISAEVMKALRKEERKSKQEQKLLSQTESLESFNEIIEEENNSVLIDDSASKDMEFELEKEEFIEMLTPYQHLVFTECIEEGMTLSEFAVKHNVSTPSVTKIIKKIRKKAEIYFRHGVNN